MSARTRLASLALAAALLALVARGARAQTCTASGAQATCTVSTTAAISIGKVTLLTVSVPATSVAPSGSDVELGYQNVSGPTITVQSNTPWSLQLAAGAAVWSATNTDPTTAARTNKPSTDLQWAVTPAASYAGLTTTSVQLLTGGPTSGASLTLGYRILYDLTLDTPGQYTLPVQLTVVAP